uniref:ETS domain-containing protein n=1 Tax=Balaenoptera musculus TaxID=9771 RepID=A0A8C0HVW0_BALMU
LDSAITLWQFLLQLLKEPQNDHMICWTSNDGEFKHLRAEEVKPKGLELAPTIMITGSDPSPLIITLALFSQTPFLTLCPLVSSIHFWSTLSPVAPLSPAGLQGTNTLFQFPSVLNSHGLFTLSSLYGPSTPGPFSTDLQKTTYALVEWEKQGTNRETLNMNIFKVCN